MKLLAYSKWDKRKNPVDAQWGLIEIAILGATIAIGFVLGWKFWLYFLPFYYLGHCCTYLNGFFLHYGGNPDKPIAWDVSSYHKWYNLLWFNNGYHVEHHFRPKLHWTKMKQFHEEIAEAQRREGVRVIRPPHALGFLDRQKKALGGLAAQVIGDVVWRALTGERLG
jgi:fatty acid desaturase